MSKVVERIYYVEELKELAEDEVLKRKGFKFEAAKTLGIEKAGYYFYLKAEPSFYRKAKALKKATLIKGKERKEILKKFKEIEESIAYGIGSLF
jgi:hypothetical protein